MNNSGNKHIQTLVPIETWCYASPEEIIKGNKIDLGLLAESLLYYDKVMIAPSNPDIFYELLSYFHKKNQLDILYGLFDDGIIGIYDHAFISTAVSKDGEFSIWNIQDQIQEKPNTFKQRYLYNAKIDTILPKARYRKNLYRAIEGNYIESKASDFDNEIIDARADFGNNERNAIIVQALINNIYSLYNLGKPPIIEVEIKSVIDGKYNITWNTDFNELNRITGNKLGFHGGLPFTALANSNRLIGTAIKLGSDLYLPSPMSSIVGNKLQESLSKSTKIHDITHILKNEETFPDIRKLVNQGILDFKDIIRIRKEARKFRNWLQEEGEKDRNAIIAYHNEVIEAVGLEKFGKKAHEIFGIFGGGGTVGGIVGALFPVPIVGAAAGGIAGGFIDHLLGKLENEWKPVVFGNWTNNYIKNK